MLIAPEHSIAELNREWVRSIRTATTVGTMLAHRQIRALIAADAV